MHAIFYTTHIHDKGSELRSEHSSAGAEMDDGENSSGGVLSRDERDWVDPYVSGGKTGQSVDFVARNGANLCESEQERSSVSELCSPPDLKSGVYDFQRCKS